MKDRKKKKKNKKEGEKEKGEKRKEKKTKTKKYAQPLKKRLSIYELKFNLFRSKP